MARTSVGYRPSGERGIYVRHQPKCPAARWTIMARDGDGRLVPNPEKEPRCKCEPWYKGRFRHEWQEPAVRDKASARIWLGMKQKNRTAVAERAAEGWTFGEASETWLARRAGRNHPASPPRQGGVLRRVDVAGL